MNNNLAACVILYNPDETVLSNIASYIGHSSITYVVDNSPKPDEKLVEHLNQIPKVKYLPQYKNVGIARALNIAFDSTLNDGFEWLLTMDQDSFIASEDFFLINDVIELDKSVAVIAARYSDDIYKPKNYVVERFFETDAVITSGNIVSVDAWKKVSGFTEKLFIDEVDNEFCIKLKKKNYKILVTKDKYLSHNLGDVFRWKSPIFKKELKMTKHSPLRMYYMSRNNLYLWKNYFMDNPKLIFERLRNFNMLLMKVILFFPDKGKYLSYIFKGVKDFFTSEYGEYKS